MRYLDAVSHLSHIGLMDDDSLPTEVVVAAAMRRCHSDGHFATLIRRGTPGRGSILVERRGRMGAVSLISQTRDRSGKPAWLARVMPTAEDANAAVTRAIQRDDDLWVVELEVPDDYWPFDGGFI